MDRTLNGEAQAFTHILKSDRNNILTEAEEECIYTHVVHAEESMGDEVAANHHSLKRIND